MGARFPGKGSDERSALSAVYAVDLLDIAIGVMLA